MNTRLRTLREDTGLSRAAFGKKIGVSGDVINNLERGRVEIKDPIIKLICREFNVSEDWLRTGRGEMYLSKTRTQEIDAFLSKAMAGRDTYKARLLHALSNMTEDQWGLLADLARQMTAEQPNPDPKSALGLSDAEMEMEAELASYRAELEAERKGAEKSAATPDTKNA